MRFSELAEPRLETGRAESAGTRLGRLFSRV